MDLPPNEMEVDESNSPPEMNEEEEKKKQADKFKNDGNKAYSCKLSYIIFIMIIYIIN